MSERAQDMGPNPHYKGRSYIERVEVGAYYTDGQDTWRVTETNPLGSVTLYGGAFSGRYRNMGIDSFRREMWRVR